MLRQFTCPCSRIGLLADGARVIDPAWSHSVTDVRFGRITRQQELGPAAYQPATPNFPFADDPPGGDGKRYAVSEDLSSGT